MIAYEGKRFVGDYDTSKHIAFRDILRWKLLHSPFVEKSDDTYRPPDIVRDTAGLRSDEDFICWLTHASFLIQLEGKRFLIDPVFGDIPFYKRRLQAPYDADTLGRIDYLLVSHVHYDHLDIPSIRRIAAYNPHAVVPERMSTLLRKAGIERTTECAWYESFSDEKIRITLLPAKHWGRRGPFDKNKVLWGAYLIESPRCKIFFCGDSAMGEHFAEIGARFAIDYALMPIGAYEPAYIMKHNHLDPEQALHAAVQLGAKRTVPMHYGTFKLSDEPLQEPLQRFVRYAEEIGVDTLVLKPGEVFVLSDHKR